MSNAFIGVGTVLKRDGISMAKITNIGGPSATRDTIDVTSFDSEGGYREFITGLRDGGTLTLDMIFTKTGYTAIKGDFENDAAVTYTLELPDTANTVITFDGLVTDFPVSIPFDDKVTFSVTVKVTGNIDVA